MDEEILTQLESEIGDGFPDFSVDTLSEFENYLSKNQNHRIRGAVLALAVHFTPKEALEMKFGDESSTEDTDTEPYIIIENHLLSEFDPEESTARSVAQKLGKLWDDWIEDSRYIPYEEAIREKLKKEQNNKCNNCNSKLDDEEASESYQHEDVFKPIHKFSRKQTKAELDHIEPLSHLGSDRIENLQLLCRFCNQGKGNRIHVPITEQIEHSYKDISSIPESHIRELFYSVTSGVDRCPDCGSIENELTMELKHRDGCFVVSNLVPVCTECRFLE